MSTGKVVVLAGTASALITDSLVFSNSGGVSFGLAGSTITASVVAGGGVAIAAGTQTVTSGTVVLVDGGGVSFGFNGQSITASVAAQSSQPGPAVGLYQNMWAQSAPLLQYTFTGSHASLLVAPIAPDVFPQDITASSFCFNMSFAGSSATGSQAATSALFVGIYTSSGGTLNLLNSCSVSVTWAADANNSLGVAGQRFWVIASSLWSSSPVFRAGEFYRLAYFWSSAGGPVNQTGVFFGGFQFASVARSGTFGGTRATQTSVGNAPFYGIYTATTTALPTSIANSELNKNNLNAPFIPHIVMMGQTGLSAF